ncbi:restriction endonuclease subunit S [Glaesserella parasuis]|uniref:Restriction endonuclease subunit S n=1 Tax=Glaesserella parasuis TaxID=738 RepID=A0AA42JJ11_GLAPU|nr:restriction endonuclease subunit S [Glaesserella parasuis]MDD2168768.1 restriction endonuclease subunit S [Glaesserella parasuis]MDP0311083.1 restriction endonuclease subunit S [Glaesserella parasuis]MDP0330490.1 restriction endonuclease subunit S [Glaesserella parasuis]MDP0393237.1 restriction endonuclease subunit S [Glaesserella parasuis]
MKDKALPEGWNKINITKVFTQISTTGKNIATKDCLSVGKYPVIDQGAEYISGYFNDETKVIPVENKVIVFGDHTRNFKLIDFDFIVGADGVKIFQPAKDIDPDFFYYQCLSLNLPNKGYHRHFRYLKECDFIYPSFSQQQKLAKKFTALLSQVAEIKQRLEKIPALLKTYRQSVLARAVNGELSAKWREENGVSLESWAISTLKNLTTKIGSGSTPKGAEYLPEGVPFIRSLNIYTHFIKFDDLAFINDEQAQKLKNVVIEQGDLLLNITGASIGRVNIAPKEFIGGRVNQHVAIIRSKLDKIRPHFLHIFFASPKIQKWINDENYGSTRQALTKGMLEELKIAVPSLEEQNYITQAVEKHLNFANQLEARVNAALERINLMTQAILAKGFRGELL